MPTRDDSEIGIAVEVGGNTLYRHQCGQTIANTEGRIHGWNGGVQWQSREGKGRGRSPAGEMELVARPHKQVVIVELGTLTLTQTTGGHCKRHRRLTVLLSSACSAITADWYCSGQAIYKKIRTSSVVRKERQFYSSQHLAPIGWLWFIEALVRHT